MKFFMKIFLFHIFLSLICSYIEDDVVYSLPDYDYKGLFYSGYLSSSKVKQFHYVFHESDKNPERKPLLLWLNGGPGCSSLSGWASEHGPMNIDKNGKFHMNEYSWHIVANTLYIESPGGVGFSYIDSDMKYDKIINDDITAEDNLNALIDFFKKFPSYKNNDFYISGESYAGIYIPMLSYKIIQYNKGVVESKKINLKGILIGNGVVDWSVDMNKATYDFAFSHHLTSYENRMEVNKYCLIDYDEEKCNESLKEINSWLEGVNVYDILRECELPTTETGDRDYFSNYYLSNSWAFPDLKKKQDELKEKLEKMKLNPDQNKNNSNNIKNKKKLTMTPPCYDDKAMSEYFNRNDVKEALHVNKDLNWELCSSDIVQRYEMQAKGSLWAFPTILDSGIRILIYNGDTDLKVPFPSNQAFIDKLNLEEIKPWTQWRAFGDKNNLAGYYVKYKGLTFCTIKGTGHMVPEWKPREAFYMLSKFLNNEDF